MKTKSETYLINWCIWSSLVLQGRYDRHCQSFNVTFRLIEWLSRDMIFYFLKKVQIDEAKGCVCERVCVCVSAGVVSVCVCVCARVRAFLGNYSSHHQSWYGNCLGHANVSRVNCIDLDLHSRLHVQILFIKIINVRLFQKLFKQSPSVLLWR